MEIVIKLGKFEQSTALRINVPSADSTITDVLSALRKEMPHWLRRTLNLSEESVGATMFLTNSPNGPEILEESKRLSDYGIEDGSTLWLMCANIASDKI